MPYTFDHQAGGSPYFPAAGRTIPDAQLYQLFDNEKLVARLFFDKTFSIIDLPDRAVGVENEARIFGPRIERLTDITRELYLGHFHLESWKAGKVRGTLSLEDGATFEFRELNKSRGLFRPDAWEGNRYEMRTPEGVAISFAATRTSRRTGFLQWESGLTGTIDIGGNGLFPAMMGLYFIEMADRMQRTSD